MTPRPFVHTDPGTPEADWGAAHGWARATTATADDLLGDVDRLIVLAAHPDDETLGAAGLLALADARGVPTDIVVATDGEGSHPGGPSTPQHLARTRRKESTRAATLAAPAARVRFLGLPDGALARRRDDLARGVADAIGDAGPGTLVAATCRDDGHADHDTLGAVAAQACRAAGARLLEYPIWAWHWARPDEFPWEDALVVLLGDAVVRAKQAAIEAHVSQVRTLAPGEPPLLGEHVLAHHRRAVEVFLRRRDAT